ncbi:hypothetical protein EIO60_02826|nr:hypothetical protein [Candidatus Pantoea persica]
MAIDLSAQKASLSLTHPFSEAFSVGTRLEARFQFCDERVLTLLTHPLPDNKKTGAAKGLSRYKHKTTENSPGRQKTLFLLQASLSRAAEAGHCFFPLSFFVHRISALRALHRI